MDKAQIDQATHTQGPWEVRRDREGKAGAIARVGHMPHATVFDRDQEPNAHLIAAAPALLSALDALYTWTSHHHIKHEPSGECCRINLEARQAIALARGDA